MSQIPQSLLDEICVCIERQVERLILKAQTVALNLAKKKNRDEILEAWNRVLAFIDPLVCSVADGENTLSATKIKAMPKA
eukprot:scaffold7011_cov113-Chaetoceros_neogracile.AAC.1